MKNLFLKKCFPLCLILLFFASCGVLTTTSVKVNYPNSVTPAWKEEFDGAERLFEAKSYAQAQKAYQAYAKNYPYNELTDKSQFRLGQIAMLNQDLMQAVSIFKELIQKTPDPAIKSKSRVKLGLSEYRQKNYGAALSAFSVIDEKYLDDREKVKMASFAIQTANEMKEDLNRKAYYYAVLFDVYESVPDAEIKSRFGSDILPKSEVRPKLKAWVEGANPVETLDRRLLTYRGKFSRPFLDFKVGKSYYESKDFSRAQEVLKRFVSKNQSHEYVAQANQILASMGVVASVARPKGQLAVGVILPLSGKYEQYGNNTLKGMECAASVRPECHGLENVRLVVKDSGGDPARAAQLVDELVTQDKVVAIVGPLPSAEVEGASKRAEANGVVMLALSQKQGVPALGEHIFRFSLTPSAQVDALLRHFTTKEKAKLFAVLYPSSNYGQEFLSEFEKTAPKFGAKINAKAKFSSSSANLSEEVRQLKLSASEVKQGTKMFDAIFIPDSYLTMSKLAPAIVAAGLQDSIIFGTNAWNDSSLASKIGSYLKKAMFVDIYFRDSDRPVAKTFLHDFQTAYAYPPSTLEAMGYDAIRILGQSLTGKKSPNKEDVKAALLKVSRYEGATGLKGFRSDREADVEPLILGVDSAGVKEIQ